ncbi:MAG: hypothetical protein N2C14_09800 [Planctomycetales bacterium]
MFRTRFSLRSLLIFTIGCGCAFHFAKVILGPLICMGMIRDLPDGERAILAELQAAGVELVEGFPVEESSCGYMKWKVRAEIHVQWFADDCTYHVTEIEFSDQKFSNALLIRIASELPRMSRVRFPLGDFDLSKLAEEDHQSDPH